jgi:spermidine synthase
LLREIRRRKRRRRSSCEFGVVHCLICNSSNKFNVTSGLGIGIAAAGLHSHGVSTTILEIDEAVYKQARSFFGLPDLQPVYFENARWWVNGQSWQLANGNASIPTYDYVVHDLFSGGSVPAKLYTDEFWKELKSIMKPDGVLAVVWPLSCLSRRETEIFLRPFVELRRGRRL